MGKETLKNKIHENNLAVVERRLRKMNEGDMAFTVRQALDKLYPGWRARHEG